MKTTLLYSLLLLLSSVEFSFEFLDTLDIVSPAFTLSPLPLQGIVFSSKSSSQQKKFVVRLKVEGSMSHSAVVVKKSCAFGKCAKKDSSRLWFKLDKIFGSPVPQLVTLTDVSPLHDLSPSNPMGVPPPSVHSTVAAKYMPLWPNLCIVVIVVVIAIIDGSLCPKYRHCHVDSCAATTLIGVLVTNRATFPFSACCPTPEQRQAETEMHGLFWIATCFYSRRGIFLTNRISRWISWTSFWRLCSLDITDLHRAGHRPGKGPWWWVQRSWRPHRRSWPCRIKKCTWHKRPLGPWVTWRCNAPTKSWQVMTSCLGNTEGAPWYEVEWRGELHGNWFAPMSMSMVFFNEESVLSLQW